MSKEYQVKRDLLCLFLHDMIILGTLFCIMFDN